jgi:hypothetical protein
MKYNKLINIKTVFLSSRGNLIYPGSRRPITITRLLAVRHVSIFMCEYAPTKEPLKADGNTFSSYLISYTSACEIVEVKRA